MRLINYIRALWSKAIPRQIEDDELIVRGIVHPLFYSDSKRTLKEGAFLPPPGRCDVSVLRRNYTSDNFCKNHASSLEITGNTYKGLATFLAKHVNDVRTQTTMTHDVSIRATPIDNNGNYTEKKVFQFSLGLPMHADIEYERHIEPGEINTQYRKYARQLAKTARYFPDPTPNLRNWSGEPLSWFQ